MDGNTTLILINIFIIGIIAIIIVKLYYRKHEEADEDIDLSFTKNALKGLINRSEKEDSFNQQPYNQNQMNDPYPTKGKDLYSNQRQGVVTAHKEDGIYAVNKVNINNDVSLHKFEKQPINYRSSDNMSQNNKYQEKVEFGSDINVDKTEKKDVANKLAKKDSFSELIDEDQSTKKETYDDIKSEDEMKDAAPDHELKDLFTIDELIKESKRKDSKRTKKINVESEKSDETDDSAKKEKETTIADIINDSEDKIVENTDADVVESYNEPSLKSPTKVEKSIDDVIKESVEEKINETTTDVDQSTKKSTYSEIYKSEEPIVRAQDSIEDQPLKEDLFEEASEVKYDDNDDVSVITPNEDDFGSSFDESSLFGIPEEDEDDFDLDYRKDIAKITKKFKNSKLYNAAKNKISSNEEDYVDDPSMNEEFLRNVRSYDQNEYEDDIATIEPIHNTAYEEVVSQKTREENTERLNKSKEIKEPPVKDNITFKLNNNEVVLHKNDEIIFNYNGDTYSSKVYKIIGNDITVKFRGQYITIKTSDIKKIF